jgi:TRAP-type C4-dicarboxylate transport system permease small subunit
MEAGTMDSQEKAESSRKLSPWEWIIAALMAGCVIVVFMQVVFRYVLQNSLIWSEELSRYLFSWMVFIGGGLAFGDDSHIVIDFAVSFLPPGARKAANLAGRAVSLAFLAVACWYGFQMVLLTRGTLSPAAGLPLNLVFYAAMPAGTLLGALFVLRNFCREIVSAGRS